MTKTWKLITQQPRRPTLDRFDETLDTILGIDTNEKMDVIKHGLEFSQFGPSLEAHLGNDLQIVRSFWLSTRK